MHEGWQFGNRVTELAFHAALAVDGIKHNGDHASRAPDIIHGITGDRLIVWKFWKESDRTAKFWREGLKITLFLAKWLPLAFILESLMLAWVPAELVSQLLGGTGAVPIAIATLVGVPAYLNGYAALPLVSGLIEQGMAPGAGMAFLVAGGVSSLPAAIAVWALVRKEVFFLYLGVALTGSFAIGLVYQLWASL